MHLLKKKTRYLKGSNDRRIEMETYQIIDGLFIVFWIIQHGFSKLHKSIIHGR